MTDDHRRIHNFMVCQLTESGAPFTVEFMADRLRLPVDRVKAVLDDFEQRVGLPIRNREGIITRAYPVTLEKSVHRMAISIGKELYADEAFGALAMSFVQKQLRGISISGHITTDCAHCHKALHILVDSDLTVRVLEETTTPILFAPLPPAKSDLADIAKLFLRESVFYCSMEHVREYRKKAGGMRGIYLPLDINQILQEAIFRFKTQE
jgi:hypothetical protein